MLNIALAKGRLGEEIYSIFEAAGYGIPGMLEKTRKLIFTDEKKGLSYFWVKPSDVAIYVERGAADIGVAGKDILLESNSNVYELLDMHRGICRVSVAGREGFERISGKAVRVATKFVNIASRFYASKFQDADIIKLNGSIELAPLLGLSDVIVDIVETGKTLKANGLCELEKICDISAWLIANKAGYRFHADEIRRLASDVESVVRNAS